MEVLWSISFYHYRDCKAVFMKYPERSYINLKKQVFIAKNILNTGQRYSNRVGKISQKIFVLK